MKLLLMLVGLSTARAEFLRIEVFMKDMDCLSCSDSLGRTFEKMRGVKHVEVSSGKGSVALELTDQNRVTLEQVWDAVKRVGFTPGDTKIAVRGSVKGHSLTVADKTIEIEGSAPEGDNVELGYRQASPRSADPNNTSPVGSACPPASQP
jgi:copper chaperone CopZ